MIWLCIVLASLAAGHLWCLYLIAQPLQMSLFLSAARVCSFAAFFCAVRRPEPARPVKAGMLNLAGCSIGYLAACFIYLKPAEPEKQLSIATRQTPAQGHTAIIYFTHGEPRMYEGSFEAWKHAIHEMDETGVPFVPWPFRPFFFKKVRDEYFRVGGVFDG